MGLFGPFTCWLFSSQKAEEISPPALLCWGCSSLWCQPKEPQGSAPWQPWEKQGKTLSVRDCSFSFMEKSKSSLISAPLSLDGAFVRNLILFAVPFPDSAPCPTSFWVLKAEQIPATLNLWLSSPSA